MKLNDKNNKKSRLSINDRNISKDFSEILKTKILKIFEKTNNINKLLLNFIFLPKCDLSNG